MDQEELNEIIGITRCVECGYRLEGEIECPFCSILPEDHNSKDPTTWIYFTACFLTSPFSIPFVISTKKLNFKEKIVAVLGLLIWGAVYVFINPIF